MTSRFNLIIIGNINNLIVELTGHIITSKIYRVILKDAKAKRKRKNS